MRWEIREFGALTGAELYAILRLRQEVFVVEQKCPYLDADGLDDAAPHLFASTARACWRARASSRRACGAPRRSSAAS